MRNQSIRKMVYLTMLSAMAIAIHLFESAYLTFMPFGIRFGLANIIAIVTLELFGIKEMILINIMRVMIGSLLRGTLFGSTFWISVGGVVLSCFMLVLSRKILKLPLYSTSMLSAIGHSVGQVLIVMMIYKQIGMLTIVPLLLISAIPTGILTGMVAVEALKHLNKNFKLKN